MLSLVLLLVAISLVVRWPDTEAWEPSQPSTFRFSRLLGCFLQQHKTLYLAVLLVCIAFLAQSQQKITFAFWKKAVVKFLE